MHSFNFVERINAAQKVEALVKIIVATSASYATLNTALLIIYYTNTNQVLI